MKKTSSFLSFFFCFLLLFNEKHAKNGLKMCNAFQGSVRNGISTSPTARFSLFATNNEQGQQRDMVTLHHTKISGFGPVEPGTPPVVIMHAILGSGKTFSTWGRSLAEALKLPRDVYLLDLRNHGESCPHVESMQYPDIAQDIAHFLDAQNIDRAVMLGHCWGGKVAASFALLHPDRTEGLVLLETSPVDYSGQQLWRYRDRLMNNLAGIDTNTIQDKDHAEQVLGELIPLPWFRAYVKANLIFDAVLQKWRWQCNLPALATEMDVMGKFSMGRAGESAADLGLKYHGPTLILAGGRSEFVKASHVKEIRKMFPQFMIRAIRQGGHFVHVDAPSETKRDVTLYLDRLPALRMKQPDRAATPTAAATGRLSTDQGGAAPAVPEEDYYLLPVDSHRPLFAGARQGGAELHRQVVAAAQASHGAGGASADDLGAPDDLWGGLRLPGPAAVESQWGPAAADALGHSEADDYLVGVGGERTTDPQSVTALGNESRWGGSDDDSPILSTSLAVEQEQQQQ